MQRAAERKYDRIGAGYALRRRPDPRIAAMIWGALGDADRVVNVGAGTGSYEPRGRRVVAVEPAIAMLRQRPPSAALAVQATAEQLPFPDASFDAALAVLTIHHWSDWRAGLRELVRVSRRRIVLFTWDPRGESSWLGDYFPSLIEGDRLRFPDLASLQEILGQMAVTPIRVPHDCTDGFMGAYWRRPSAYLDPMVRSAISSLATEASSVCLASLADDLNTGAWERRHGQVLKLDEIDLGYRLIVAQVGRI
jgi:SAM-dependent methyltransferase